MQEPTSNSTRFNQAESLARSHHLSARPATRKLLPQLRTNARLLYQTHKAVSQAVALGEPLTPDGEWLLDNFYVIEEIFREIQDDLPRAFYDQLPALAAGEDAGLPRCYSLAANLLASTDHALDEPILLEWIDGYQSVTPLTIGELWAIPTMFRIALLERLARLAAGMLAVRRDYDRARVWLATRGAVDPSDCSDAFLVGLLRALREGSDPGAAKIEGLQRLLAQARVDAAELYRREHSRQASNQVAIGTCITSLRLLGVLDWSSFVEKASRVEKILRGEPTGQYARQDFATRDAHRRAVERLARDSRRDEDEVARQAVQLAGEAAPDSPQSCVGYHMLGEGEVEFGRALGYRPRWRDGWRRWLLNNGEAVYFGLLGGGTLAILLLVVLLSFPLGWGVAALLVLLSLLPATEIAAAVANFLVVRMVPPRVLAKYDFSKGIPQDCATCVAIPSLLTDVESGNHLARQLERHYLSNPDGQLRFALLTDYADAATETLPADAEILRAAEAAVTALNRRYPHPAGPRFLLLHRRRQWNAVEGCWMGWERKRGKLHEFNRWLRGDEATSYTLVVGRRETLPHIRFVLTLDADTVLPRDAAHQLIGTLAHPLNRARVEGRRVVAGYTILQPRVTYLFSAGLASYFASVYAASAGIDPYSSAVSDVYMDLFGEGTFTGKGLYDVDAFEATAGAAFPENAILSHDLIEGNFARCGLVSDVQFFDGFPARYPAYARREHRWVRGDWQLLPWLGAAPPRPGGSEPNPLPRLARWKILDNLRRSLVPVAVVVGLIASWFGAIPPVTFATLTLVMLFLPLVLLLTETTLRTLSLSGVRTGWAKARASVGPTFVQAMLTGVLLMDQTANLIDAIGRTLWRLFVSRRRMLEWETAAATERRLGGGLWQFLHVMRAGLFLTALVALAVWLVPGSTVAWPWLVLWAMAPVVAFLVSLPLPAQTPRIAGPDRERFRVLARRTWDFFETFAGPADHWLPPDNYQEIPTPKVAHRTSPTNMGLLLVSTLNAHDLGYIGLPRLTQRLTRTLETFARLPRFHGHFLNWYDTRTLEVLQPGYVSTVDSGNLLACLLVLKHGLVEKADEPIPSAAWLAGLRDLCALWDESGGSQAGLCKRIYSASPTRPSEWLAFFRSLPEAVPEAEQDAAKHWAERFGEAVQERIDELLAFYPWLPELGEWSAAGLFPEMLRELDTAMSPSDLVRHLPRWREAHPAGAGVFDRCAAPSILEETRLLRTQLDAFVAEMDFRFLYNPERELFSIGYHLPRERLDTAHYDLLASEAAITSFLAVSRGEAPRKHWFQLGRPFTRVAGRTGLLSWGGTMFEFLMPRLFLPAPPGSLLDTMQRAAVRRQIESGRELGLPWGVSESGFNLMDGQANYQYQAFGVRGLGVKRGLERDQVVAPYATVMAVEIDPTAVLANLRKIEEAGGLGTYGLYEAIDYTPDRVPAGKRGVVVRSYMAHHQGMTFVALANVLLGQPNPRRLRAEPTVRAAALLLEERVPDAPLETAVREEEERVNPEAQGETVSRRLTTAATAVPRTHLLSNGRYSVMLTNAGSGSSNWNGVEITRWRADTTRDNRGQYIYLRDVATGVVRGVTAQPLNDTTDTYEVVYSLDKAEFQRQHDSLESLLEVIVPPDLDGEVRRLTLVNHGAEPRLIEVTSFAEVVLTAPNADRAHPAFQKLFVTTEWLPQSAALVAGRRPRQKDEATPWAAHQVVSDAPFQAIEFETDREKFLGRRRDASNPIALEKSAPPLSGSVGPVLDPAFALRVRVRIEPGTRVEITFVTVAAGSREALLESVRRMQTPMAVGRAFELAWAHARVELWDLKISVRDAHIYQRLAGHLLYPAATLRAPEAILAANHQGLAGLWRHGISGDRPIILVRTRAMAEEAELVRHLLTAHSYLRLRGLSVDLVVVNDVPSSYQDGWMTELTGLVRATHASESLDRPGGVFLRKADHFAQDDLRLLSTAARAVFHGERGSLADQVSILDPLRVLPPLLAATSPRTPASDRVTAIPESLRLFNGIGGFSSDGSEYVLPANREPGAMPPAPWVNVIANPEFGCLVSDSGLGYTWAQNCQLNRLTPWSNDPVSDPPSAVVYLRDEASGAAWSVTPLPCGGPTEVRHGQGYTRFRQNRAGLEQTLDVFVAPDEAIQFIRLKIRNRRKTRCRLSATFYAEWVLGANPEQTGQYLLSEVDQVTGAILVRNPFSLDFPGVVAFADVLRRPRSLTGDRREFLGRNGSPAKPAALGRVKLSDWTGGAADSCAALQTPFVLEAGAETVIVFVIGQGRDHADARRILNRYRTVAAADQALVEVKQKWDNLLTAVQVETPDEAFDLLVNRWLLYQVISGRLWGRTGFYQSGGAYGYRDQLQDVMAVVLAEPKLAREQIVRAAGRQFEQGDVQHWWHPPTGRGVRTRFADDFLWLPFVTAHYVAVTGDRAVLDESVTFLSGPELEPGQDDVYSNPSSGQASGSIYEHCLRAIDRGWRLGQHGLPLMGSGDWNDGMNLVGAGGQGESVWLAWFQIRCLRDFLPLAEARGDRVRVEQWRERIALLAEAVDEHAWDGGWYRRAYFDDGTPLGSAENAECRIDSLAQSWAVLAGEANPERARQALMAAVNQLVRQGERLVLLFAPPFDKTPLEPGYIKGYLPGVRENGGQYTHAACWVVQALAEVGEADLAYWIFDLINPLRHGDGPARVARYRIEPYVVAGDIYGAPPFEGRGGWSWYTGAAGWLYQAAIFSIAGLQIRNGRLQVKPRMPFAWRSAVVTLRIGKSHYRIEFDASLLADDKAEFDLIDDGMDHSLLIGTRRASS